MTKSLDLARLHRREHQLGEVETRRHRLSERAELEVGARGGEQFFDRRRPVPRGEFGADALNRCAFITEPAGHLGQDRVDLPPTARPAASIPAAPHG